ncbi:MAG: hypothetical protein IT578_01965 [Verrucomicrobiae bacterium]|nr:hypothetical protein [Verrucomicrobiae bacterium]
MTALLRIGGVCLAGWMTAAFPQTAAAQTPPAPAASHASPPAVPQEEVRYGAAPANATNSEAAPHEMRIVGAPPSSAHTPIPEIQAEPTLASFGKVFVDRFGLAVPLGDVVVLVILTNVFALFRASRMILLMSYLFSLKWVVFSNYQEVARYSSSMAHLTTMILAICGIFTLVLFCLDWFNKR